MLQLAHKNPLLSASVLILIFVLLRVLVIPGGFTGFIAAGTAHCDASVPVSKVEGPGYDGQYFYRYALAPFDTTNPFNGITTDTPAYRHQRIGYPLLVWLLSFGFAPAVPYAMVLLNLLGFVLLAAGVKKLFTAWNKEISPLVALLVPGLWMSFARDLAEVQEAVLFVYLVLAFVSGRRWLFLLAGVLMVFTREPSAVVLAAFGLYQLLAWVSGKKEITPAARLGWIIAAAAPVALFIIFRMLLFVHYSQGAGEGTDDFCLIPFYGLAEGFGMQWAKTMQGGLAGWVELAFYAGNLLVIAGWMVAGTSRIRKGWPLLKPHEQWLWLTVMAWWVITMLFSYKIWEDDWGFARILTIPVLASVLLGRLPRLLLIFTAAFTALTIARLIVRV